MQTESLCTQVTSHSGDKLAINLGSYSTYQMKGDVLIHNEVFIIASIIYSKMVVQSCITPEHYVGGVMHDMKYYT